MGAAGTGKTLALVRRHAWLATAGGLAPEHVLGLAPSEGAADATRAAVEDELDAGYEELTVDTVPGVCARILRDEALEAGIDPFVVPVGPGDRLAMLRERVDELTLRLHDFGGDPTALLAGVVARIDHLKAAMVTPAEYARWAHELPAGDERAEREREFAAVYEAHDRMLAEQGAVDVGGLVLRAVALLRERPHVRARVGARWRHVLVDDAQDLELAGLRLVSLLAEHGGLTAAGDDDCAVRRSRGAAPANLRELAAGLPGARTIRLEQSLRCGRDVLTAAHAVVAPIPDRIEKPVTGAGPGAVRFWRAANERAQAQGVAAEVERLVRGGVAAEDVAVLVRSVRHEGQAVAVALEERAVPYRLAGATAFFTRAEVRDVIAWLRLLVDPGDAGAVVRAWPARRSSCAPSTSLAASRSRGGESSTWSARSSPRRSRPSSRPRPASASCASSSSTARRRGRWTPPAPTCSCTASSTASGCAASSSSPRRPTWSSAWCRSRSWATSPPRTCAATRRPPGATSPAR